MSLSPFALHRNYRLSRTHVADIREPLVKAVWYYRYSQQCERDCDPFSRDPDQRESYDFWMEEAERAMNRCDAILADLRSTRELERLADGYANNNAILSTPQMGAREAME